MKTSKNLRKAQIKYYEKNKEEILKQQRERRKKFPHILKEISDKYRASEKGEDSRLRIYGITKKEYDTLFKKQKGVCKICNKEENSYTRRGNKITKLFVDHNHNTGKVRGLLCSDCNKGLGNFKDNINSLKKTINYLRKNLC